MPDVKTITRLEDWFDAVVLLGDGPPQLPTALTPIRIREPADIQGQLRAKGLKRPLVVATDPAFAAACAELIEPIKVCDAKANPALLRVCDLALPLSDHGWQAEVLGFVQQGLASRVPLNVLVLYHDGFTHIECTREHMTAFATRSRHQFSFLPADETLTRGETHYRLFDDYQAAWPQGLDFSLFDAVVWHYSLPAYRQPPAYKGDYISAAVLEQFTRYDGLKIVFVQDEYDNTATTWDMIRRTGAHVVMTVVPETYVGYAYPPSETPGVEYITTLTGFVPDSAERLEQYSLPVAARSLRIAYRGRRLPFRYGDLAREKAMIGLRMRELAAERGVAADIEIDEDKRIYGEDWYRFLGSARATLATESGSNVFDFDGSISAIEEAGVTHTYEQFHAAHLAALEGKARMNQVSAKVFEAIALRTALICFEGEYSGAIRPYEHFIPLKKDFSNVDEVFAAVEDVKALKAMTDRAYRDVIQSGLFGYPAFAARFDDIIDSRTPRPARAEIISAPIAVRRRGQADFTPIVRRHGFEYAVTDAVLAKPFQLRQLEEMMAGVLEAQSSAHRRQTDRPPADARTVWSAGPDAVCCFEYWRDAGATLKVDGTGAHITTPPIAWHYSQGVNLDFTGVDFERDYCWIRLDVADVAGRLFASLHNTEDNSIVSEALIPAGEGAIRVYLKAHDAALTMLLLRTGDRDETAKGVVLGVQIVVASVWLPQLLEIVRRQELQG
jgi:hypothetical protein